LPPTTARGTGTPRLALAPPPAPAAALAPAMCLMDLLSETNDPRTDQHFDLCRAFLADLSDRTKFKLMHDSKLITLFKCDKSAMGGRQQQADVAASATGGARVFVCLSKPLSIDVHEWFRLGDDASFIKSVDSSIMEYQELQKLPRDVVNSPSARRDGIRPPGLVYYSYRMPLGLKNRCVYDNNTTSRMLAVLTSRPR
jgi:hypothetical protein